MKHKDSFRRRIFAKELRKNVQKYMDRINDKLFAFNTMLIAGYFVLIAIPNISINSWWFVLPVINMLLSILIELRFLNYSSYRVKMIEEKVGNENITYMKTRLITWLLFISRVLTIVTAIIFVYQVISINK